MSREERKISSGSIDEEWFEIKEREKKRRKWFSTWAAPAALYPGPLGIFVV